MALIEWDRGLGSALLDHMATALTVTRRELEGSARLTFPGGRSVPVTARLTLFRSPFSSWGDGSLDCQDEIGFDALGCGDWLVLTFRNGAQVEIDVHHAKACNKQCHCLFEVKP